MSTLGGIDDVSDNFAVAVLILDHSYNTHSPPVISQGCFPQSKTFASMPVSVLQTTRKTPAAFKRGRHL